LTKYNEESIIGYIMFIYIIGSTNGPYKIGFSKNPETRLRSLQTGNSDKLKVLYTENIDKSSVRFVENRIHSNLKHRQIKGEWFNIPLESAILEVKYANMRYS
jgi:predicted GIY-YIG superfamily endonuclease